MGHLELKVLDAKSCIKSLGNATRDNNEQFTVKIGYIEK